jgi:Calpain family cysteine protease
MCKINGIMKKIAIDDYVPVYKETNRPVFSKANKNCIWVMLIEKLWAKLKGSYGDILNGNAFDVLNAFCLGPCYTYSTTSVLKQE